MAGESEDFIILDNHDNTFVSDDDLIDDSSTDNDSLEIKTVNDDDSNNSKGDSSDDSSDDSSSDDESENSGVSDRRLSEEEVKETDRQQDHFNLHGACNTRVNLPPPRASHRSGLRQSWRANYTHTTIDHTKNNSKAWTKSNHTNTNSKRQGANSNHTNTNNKRQSTPKTKYEYIENYVINNSKRTNKHKSREQENSYYDHNSKHDKKIKPFLDSISSYNKDINEINYFINHVLLTQYDMQKDYRSLVIEDWQPSRRKCNSSTTLMSLLLLMWR